MASPAAGIAEKWYLVKGQQSIETVSKLQKWSMVFVKKLECDRRAY